MFVTASSCRWQTELKRAHEEVISGIAFSGVQTITYTARVPIKKLCSVEFEAASPSTQKPPILSHVVWFTSMRLSSQILVSIFEMFLAFTSHIVN